MKTIRSICFVLLAALAAVTAAPLRTGFDYQGRLSEGADPANGVYEFRFALFDAVISGTQAGNTVTNANVSVTNGLFNTAIDFGAAVFDGTQYWMEIGVRPNGGGAAFTPLAPRQLILPTPYALYALSSAGVAANAVGNDGLAPNAVTAEKIAPGQVVKSLNGLNDAVSLLAGENITLTPSGQGITIASAGADDNWHLLGNLGTAPGVNFVGTRDNQPLELRVNNTRALRLEPTPSGAPNLIGGGPLNSVRAGIVGATIGGGGAMNYNGAPLANRIEANFGTIGGGPTNLIATAAESATIGGGATNLIERSASFATIGGGLRNNVQFLAPRATIAGGGFNLIGADTVGATVGGGESNQVHSLADWATVSGGNRNHVEGSCDYGFIGGGQFNRMRGDANWSAISGGLGNFIDTNSNASAIGGGVSNTVQRFAGLAAIVGGQNNRIFNGAVGAAIGGGVDNSIFGGLATVAGGQNNSVSLNARFASISGGASNWIGEDAAAAHISGGSGNEIDFAAGRAFVGGGERNVIQASHATVSGGQSNQIGLGASLATIAGGRGNEITAGASRATISGGLQNRILASYGSIGGGRQNEIGTAAAQATVAGGDLNIVNAFRSSIGGGFYNGIGVDSPCANIGGGCANYIANLCAFATIGGGDNNFIVTSTNATIGGGGENDIGPRAHRATIGGGYQNLIETNAMDATIAGGYLNSVFGRAAMVPGGYGNYAVGDFSLAGGYQAWAAHPGCFVWADTQGPAYFQSVTSNEFAARCTGGVRFVTGVDRAGGVDAGVRVPPGGNAWQALSDRNAKTNFAPVNGRDLLEKLAAVPMTTWNYKSQDASIRHIGPMAQDFYAAFGVGEDDRHITTIDADGVALAAIQGLNALAQSQAAEITALKKDLAELRALLSGAGSFRSSEPQKSN